MKRINLALLSLLLLGGCYFNEEPIEDNSPWPYVQPEEIGQDELVLLDLNNAAAGRAFDRVTGIIAVQDGQLFFENYYLGISRGSLRPLSTASMSVLSLLVGVAIEEGFIDSVETTIDVFYPNKPEIFDQEPLKASITIEHLLTMQSGIAWYENGVPILNSNNSINGLERSSDWLDYILQTDLDAAPGLRYSYNSAHGLILADILAKASGQSFQEFAQQYLFSPLNSKEVAWELDPAGNVNAGYGLSMTLIDFTKLGYLLLQEGDWFGKRIVDASWVDYLRSRKVQIDSFNDYAASWWLFSEFTTFTNSFIENDIYYAEGAGGQYLFVVPHADLVVGVMAENYLENRFVPLVILRDYFSTITGNQ